MGVDPADDTRETGVGAGDERGILLDYLRYYRLTIELKCADLLLRERIDGRVGQ